MNHEIPANLPEAQPYRGSAAAVGTMLPEVAGQRAKVLVGELRQNQEAENEARYEYDKAFNEVEKRKRDEMELLGGYQYTHLDKAKQSIAGAIEPVEETLSLKRSRLQGSIDKTNDSYDDATFDYMMNKDAYQEAAIIDARRAGKPTNFADKQRELDEQRKRGFWVPDRR